MLEQITPPGWGPPRHNHSHDDEIFYILEGSYDLHVGDEHRTVSAGASAILPRNVPHGFRNVGVEAQPFALCHCSWWIGGIFPGRSKMFAGNESRPTDRIGATVWLDSAAARELKHGVEIITLAVRPAIARHSEEEPLRARKKIQTRQRISEAAASLFAAKGYDAVTVAEIARVADVSEQTVYNFFPSKELLVLDEDAAFEALLVRMIRERPARKKIADAVRAGAHAFLKRLQARPNDPKSRGGLPCLMNSSPQVRRFWLAALDRYASSISTALVKEGGGKVSPLASRLLGCSIVTIFSLIIEETGRATLRGVGMRSLNKLHTQIDDAVDRLAPALNSITSR